MPYMNAPAEEAPAELPEEMRFLLEVEDLKEIERQNPLAKGDRRERVAEHSWHVAVAAILLQDFSDESEAVDLGRAALLAVAHDVVETWWETPSRSATR